MALVAWIPLAGIDVVQGFRVGALDPHFQDLSLHARLLVAVPLAHLGRLLLAHACQVALRRLAEEGLGPPAPLDAMAARVVAWSTSRRWIAPLAIVSLLFGQALFWSVVTTPALKGEQEAGGVEFRWLWLTWISLPVFYFVVLRALLLWFGWCWVLLRVARLPLRLSAAHPDYAGGLEFLVRPSLAFCLVVLGLASIVAAAWGADLLFEGAVLSEFAKLFAAWIVLALLVTLGPLLALSPRLLLARLGGLSAFGRLSTSYTRQFEARWVESPPDRPLLGTSDLQSLADLGNSFRVVREMRLLVFDLRHVAIVLAAATAPILPLLLTKIPLRELLLRIAETMVK